MSISCLNYVASVVVVSRGVGIRRLAVASYLQMLSRFLDAVFCSIPSSKMLIFTFTKDQ